MSYDVIVIGAGIVGAATARSLALTGRRVAVVERGAAASGTSAHGEGNLLVSDKGPGPELDLALDATKRWPRIAAELADENPEIPSIEFEPKGGIVVATTEQGARPLVDFAARQAAAGVDAQPIGIADARRLEPWLNERLTAAVWYPQDAQVQPTIATEAFLASARRAGARVHAATTVIGALEDAGGALAGVRTDHGALTAPVVVNCAGPWAGRVAGLLGAPIPVRPRRGMVLVTTRLPHRVRHKVYDADYVGAVGSSDAALQTSSVVESTSAGTVLIGSSRQQVGFRDDFRAEIIAELARKATLLFPFLRDASALRAYSGFRPYMPDHLPLIGPDPRRPGLWHATGHEGAGIGLAVSTAALVRDLMDGLPTAVRADGFAISRPTLAPHLEKVAA